MNKIAIVVGTRPNFIKVTQFKKHAHEFGFEVDLIHTGQHYDQDMAKVFFDQFELQPDRWLTLKNSTSLSRIGEMIEGLEKEFLSCKPNIVLVCGDVDSTLAGAIVAQRLGIPLGHIESGLRSFDRTMPEEVNRILVDDLSDFHFVTEESGLKNLAREGKTEAGVKMVGNTMIDTLVAYKDKIDAHSICLDLNLTEGEFVLVTMHRPGNVDNEASLNQLGEVLKSIADRITVVLPIHPRTQQRMIDLGLKTVFDHEGIICIAPQGYFSFQKLIKHAALVLTDSGGIQEETTFLGVPCLTVRPNTERPITIDLGTNVLLELDSDKILKAFEIVLSNTSTTHQVPPLWDGNSTQRILSYLRATLEKK